MWFALNCVCGVCTANEAFKNRFNECCEFMLGDGHIFLGGTSLIWTPLGQRKVSVLVRSPYFRGCNVHKQCVSCLSRCPYFRGVLNEEFHCT